MKEVITISVNQLIKAIEQLTDFHQQLLSLSKNKTEAIKESDNEQLVKHLTKERQVIQKVERLEQARVKLVDQFFTKRDIQSDERTITELLQALPDKEDQKVLEKSVAQLIQLIVALRENEQLNNELLQQSMQFVQLSLDMIQPQTQHIHYGEQAKTKRSDSLQKRSVFDSKV